MRRCWIWQGNDHYLHPAPRVAQFGAATRLTSKRQQTLALCSALQVVLRSGPAAHGCARGWLFK